MSQISSDKLISPVDVGKERALGTRGIAAIVLLFLPIPVFIIVAIHKIVQPTEIITNFLIDMIGLIFSYILFVTCVMSYHGNEKSYRLFLASVVSLYINFTLSLTACVLFNNPNTARLLFFIYSLCYFFGITEYTLFAFYTVSCFPSGTAARIFITIACALTAFYFVFLLLNPFFRIFFCVTPSGEIIYYNNDPISTVVLLCQCTAYLIFVLTRKCSTRKKISFASYAALPLTASLISGILILQSTGFVNTFDALANIYYLVPTYLIFFHFFADRERQLLAKDRALNDARVDLMLSQIQPHFIYNSLTAIIGLIDVDHEKAKYSIVAFSDYLRVNLEALKEVKLIPFEKELEHCRTYLQFEQLRFDNLQVEYDIRTTGFYLPVLTVQPIIENAVKHGVSVREQGGTVRISTRDLGASVQILVEDDGVGFDTAAIPGLDASHVGFSNVASRLADHGGTIVVDSDPDCGTRVTITIPKNQGEAHEDFSA